MSNDTTAPQFLRQSDAFTWEMEHDPTLRSTVVTVFLLDEVPDADVVRDRFERIGRTLPMFRQRIVPSPAGAPPRWEIAPDLDLDFHLRRVTASEPGDLAAVLEFARRAAMDDFDRARPLWEVTLVEGVDDPDSGAKAALVVKLHHSLTDGVGGVEIALALFDFEREPDDRGPMPEAPAPVHQPSDAMRIAHAWSEATAYDSGVLLTGLRGSLRAAPRLTRDLLLRPVPTARSGVELAASVYRTVRPIREPGSPLMRDRGLVRQLRVHQVSLQALKDAAHAGGGSLNDAFLAAVAGGLRRYHEEHGIAVEDLHVTMPVSLREDGDPMGGNRITLMRFDVPVGVADPAERIARTHARAGRVRHERSLPWTQLIAGALNRVPRSYIASILRHVDFLASDVPGIPVPVYVGGARVIIQYAFGPTIGAAVNVTLMTYVDTCALGVNVDTAAIPDVELFDRCLAEGFAEVVALGAGA